MDFEVLEAHKQIFACTGTYSSTVRTALKLRTDTSVSHKFVRVLRDKCACHVLSLALTLLNNVLFVPLGRF